VFVLSTASESRMLDYFSFVGRMVGVATRHAMQLGLSLPRTFWKSIVGLALEPSDLASFDAAAWAAMDRNSASDMVRGLPAVCLCVGAAVPPSRVEVLQADAAERLMENELQVRAVLTGTRCRLCLCDVHG
jgi:hypothetical protein